MDSSCSRATRDVLGEHAAAVPITSTKSATGHLIGAAGAVELIATCCAVNTGLVPPTLNCEKPLDPN